MPGNKFSVGIWFLGESRDRFSVYKEEPVTIEARFKLAGEMDEVGAMELHYPNEISDDTIEDVKKYAKNAGLEIASVVPNLFAESKWQYGAVTSPDPKVREAAVNRMIRTMEINRELGCEFMILWPGEEGNDGYILTSNYVDQWNWFKEACVKVLEAVADVNIALEHKPNDPKVYITAGNTGKALLMCREVNEALGSKRMGMNIEVGHVQIARENLAEAYSLTMKDDLLFHVHLNDNNREKEGDTDLMVGSANFMETLELFFWLKELAYEGWYGLDLFPTRISAKKAVEQSIANVRYIEALVDALPREEIMHYMKEPDAAETMRIVRETMRKGV
jgi:xylose isomerase